MAESDKPPEQTPEQKPTPNQQAIEDLSWDIPFARTILNFFIREGKAVKNGWLAVGIIVGITIYCTRSCTEGDVDAQISAATNYFGGELLKKENETSYIKGQLTDAKQERDKYQLMLAPFEAMAIAKYTNAPLDQRLDLLAGEVADITNAMSVFAKHAILELQINGSTNLILNEPEIGNNEVRNSIIVTNRQLRIRILNRSKYSSINSFIYFMSLLDATNIIIDGWQREPQTTGGFNSWKHSPDNSIPRNFAWDISTILISTNFIGDSFSAEFEIGSDNSESKIYFVGFHIQK